MWPSELQLVMNIIENLELIVYEFIVGIMKHVIADATEIARILWSPFVIHRHFYCFENLTAWTLLETQSRLEHD